MRLVRIAFLSSTFLSGKPSTADYHGHKTDSFDSRACGVWNGDQRQSADTPHNNKDHSDGDEKRSESFRSTRPGRSTSRDR
ncbi:hypothetical protein LY76DRAFT_636370, partial [Colletotrichum caudatum]